MPKPKIVVPSYSSIARLEEALKLRSLAERSQEAYLSYIIKFAQHLKRDPATADEAEARGYLVYLRDKRDYSPSSMRSATASRAPCVKGPPRNTAASTSTWASYSRVRRCA